MSTSDLAVEWGSQATEDRFCMIDSCMNADVEKPSTCVTVFADVKRAVMEELKLWSCKTLQAPCGLTARFPEKLLTPKTWTQGRILQTFWIIVNFIKCRPCKANMLDKLCEELGPERTRVITFAVLPDGLTGERPQIY